jgi:thiol-disulfide isomerase/thioredoxin
MSTKKILLIVGGIVAVLGLLVVLFVGSILYVAFSTIGKSEAAQTAKTFLRQNEKLKSDIGEVRDFGFWVTGDINSSNSNGQATLYLKVLGAKKTVGASVSMTYRNGREWNVVEASYRNDAGQTVELLDAYGDDQPVEASVKYVKHVREVNADDFAEKVLREDVPVLVLFTVSSSAETERLWPALAEVAEKYSTRASFYMHYADGNHTLMEQYGVQVTPTLILFADGKERARIEGSRPAAEISRMIERQLKK